MNYAEIAKQRWPQAAYILDSGRWALIRDCGGRLTVSLYANLTAAQEMLQYFNTHGCAFGIRCDPSRHHLIDLDNKEMDNGLRGVEAGPDDRSSADDDHPVLRCGPESESPEMSCCGVAVLRNNRITDSYVFFGDTDDIAKEAAVRKFKALIDDIDGFLDSKEIEKAVEDGIYAVRQLIEGHCTDIAICLHWPTYA